MRLPPLNALRAFEAAARHGGYSGAAEELFVTRGAVSRHVKQLEEHLGVELFTRLPQGVELTEAGRRFLPVLSDSFQAISRRAKELSQPRNELRISCAPTFSIRWLIPKLDDFHEKHPEIKVRLTTNFYTWADFDSGDFDLAVGCDPNWVGTEHVEVLSFFPMIVVPACTPLLAKKLSDPKDLATATLLHETRAHHDWRAWCETFPIEGLDPSEGIELPNLDMAVKAAVMNKGVVMGDLVLSREEFESGQLVMPFPDMLCLTDWKHFALRGRKETWRSPQVQAFTNWAREAAAPDAAYCREKAPGLF